VLNHGVRAEAVPCGDGPRCGVAPPRAVRSGAVARPDLRASPGDRPYIPPRVGPATDARAEPAGGWSTVATRADTRRRHARHTVAPESGATVEVELPPRAGRRATFPLVDVSHSGVSFRCDGPALHCLDTGTRLGGAVVRIGECVLHGDLVVMHLTPEGLAGALCGALFYPESDAELVKLKSVIAGMEALGRR
jgi:hypothetical protein